MSPDWPWTTQPRSQERKAWAKPVSRYRQGVSVLLCTSLQACCAARSQSDRKMLMICPMKFHRDVFTLDRTCCGSDTSVRFNLLPAHSVPVVEVEARAANASASMRHLASTVRKRNRWCHMHGCVAAMRGQVQRSLEAKKQ